MGCVYVSQDVGCPCQVEYGRNAFHLGSGAPGLSRQVSFGEGCTVTALALVGVKEDVEELASALGVLVVEA